MVLLQLVGLYQVTQNFLQMVRSNLLMGKSLSRSEPGRNGPGSQALLIALSEMNLLFNLLCHSLTWYVTLIF